jgi:hypothetical protein
MNTEKIKYMLISGHQNTEQDHNITIVYMFFENMVKLRYFGMM